MQVSVANPDDCDAMLALFPRLATFELPNGRIPEHLWSGDANMLKRWATGAITNCLVNVARDDDGSILGVAMVTLRPELLSHNPSAHLEVLVVAKSAEGRGVGTALLEAAEMGAREQGAQSMSLHVFANNTRARWVYEKAGFDGELLRCIKLYSEDALK